MTYGMTKEQLIAANRELIKAVQIKDERIHELEARVMAYENNEPMTLVDGKTVPSRFGDRMR